MTVAVVVYVIVDIAIDQPENLVSVAGMALYVIFFYITSINPARVSIRLRCDYLAVNCNNSAIYVLSKNNSFFS